MKERPLIKKSDIFIIVAVLVLAVCFLVLLKDKGNTKILTVTVNGKSVFSENLLLVTKSYDKKIIDDGIDIILRISKDGAEVIESSCENQDCKAAGRISKTGQVIVCLPQKTVIEISSRKMGKLITY